MITAIVASFYEERQKYRAPIVEALRNSTLAPDRFLFWNNRDYRYGDDLLRIPQIWSHENTLLGRYAAVFVSEMPYVFVQDDDVLVGPETIERMFEVARENPARIVGAFGMNLGQDPEKPYTSGRRAVGECDVVLGRMWMCHKMALIPFFDYVLAHGNLGRCDDIAASLLSGGGIAITDPGTTDLDEEGVGLCHEPQHFEERDAFTRDILIRMGVGDRKSRPIAAESEARR